MAQFYTLDEAAQRLQMPADEFKRRLKIEWTSIRPFRDGPTLRFRVVDIDELARSLGAASDPGLQMGPVGSKPADSSGDFLFTTDDSKPDDEPLHIVADDDIFSTPPKSKPGSGSDSDVRLDFAPNRPNIDNSNPTEEIAIDFSGPSSAIIKPSSGSGKLSAPKSGSKLGSDSGKIPGPSSASSPPPKPDDSSSEFELSLDPDNDSFEFQLTSDSSEEVELGGLTFKPENGGAGQSGINLGRPQDSGPSLEKSQGPKTGPLPKPTKKADSDSDIDFELSLESSPTTGTTGQDSDSEFELTLDDNSGVTDALAESYNAGEEAQSDIFETDFELPAIDDESASDVATVESDTDLENVEFDAELEPVEDESASQVVLIDDELEPVLDDDEAPRASTRRRGAMAGMEDNPLDALDLDDEMSASQALRGAHRGDDDYGTMPSQMVVANPPKWGALPAIVLFMTLPLMFIGTLMSFEVIRGMWGYQQPTRPGNLLVRSLAESIASPIKD